VAWVIRVALVIGLAEWPGCLGGLGGQSNQGDKDGQGVQKKWLHRVAKKWPGWL
jgi:hypothetical protein